MLLEIEEEDQESDFLLPTPTDDFLQPDVAPDIPSQLSQLTVMTEYGGIVSTRKSIAAAPADHDSGRRTSILSRGTDSRKISGDFTVGGTLVKIPSKVSVHSCEMMCI